jgi:hypothetical protein
MEYRTDVRIIVKYGKWEYRTTQKRSVTAVHSCLMQATCTYTSSHRDLTSSRLTGTGGVPVSLVSVTIVTQVVSLTDGDGRTMKNGVFWDVMPCGSCKNRRFGGTQRLLHQGDKNR